MTQEGKWTITPVDDPPQAVRNMDIVVTSIPPGDVKPVTGEALAPGTLLIPLDLVNSWQDDVLLVGRSGGCRQPCAFLRSSPSQAGNGVSRAQGSRSGSRISWLGKSPRASASDRKLIAVCGIASTDVVVGWEIYRRARAANIGLEFDMQG